MIFWACMSICWAALLVVAVLLRQWVAVFVFSMWLVTALLRVHWIWRTR